MPNYANSKIYTIKIKDDNSVYIGSTTQVLKRRLIKHKKDLDTTISKYIKEKYNGDWSLVFIEEYEKYPCSCRKELCKKEGEIIRLFKDNQEYNCLNRCIAGRTDKEWRKENNYDNSEKRKEYLEKNKEKRKEYHRNYMRGRREKIKSSKNIEYQ